MSKERPVQWSQCVHEWQLQMRVSSLEPVTRRCGKCGKMEYKHYISWWANDPPRSDKAAQLDALMSQYQE